MTPTRVLATNPGELYSDPDVERPKTIRHSMTSDRTMVVIPSFGEPTPR
jgi:hypothetical protein